MRVLPREWERIGFDDLVEVVSDGNKRVRQSDYLDEGSVPVVDQGEGLVGGYTDDERIAYAGPLPLVVFGDHTRRVKFVDFRFAVGAQGTKLLRPRADLHARFVYYLLCSVRLEDRGYGRHFALLRAEDFPLPPLPEQRRIADAIEEQFSRLDAAEGAIRGVVRRAPQLLAALRADAFAGDWPHRRLDSVAETMLGKMLSAKAKTGVGATPYLRNKNVRWGSIDIEDVAEMDFTDTEREKFRLAPGDVLICEGGAGVGRTAIWRGEIDVCCFQKALHRVRTCDELLPEYLAQFFRYFSDSKLLEKQLSGVAIGHFPQEDLRSLEIPVPPLHEQQRFVDEFSTYEDLTGALADASERARTRSGFLRRAILATAFAGGLVPQDPSDESASVLLERIAAERAATKPSRRKKAAS